MKRLIFIGLIMFLVCSIFTGCLVFEKTNSIIDSIGSTLSIGLVKPNYFNYGNVSEENSASILVSPIYDDGIDYQIVNLVKINGEGDVNQWRRNSSLRGTAKAIVRVMPDEYTFTISYIWGDKKTEIPVDITHIVSAGKGYIFHFSALFERNPILLVKVTIRILECDSADLEYYGGKRISSLKEVAKMTDRHYLSF